MYSRGLINITKLLALNLVIWLNFTSINAKATDWPLWDSFKQHLISKDGRVIDYYSENAYTTSEGQSYALFFALVANEPELFEALFRWTQNNLADGNLKKTLPAWQWGKNQGQWQVTDSNSASDSDLWIAYCLLEASRVWQNSTYKTVGLALAQRILAQETAEIPNLGLTLLPGRYGFSKKDSSGNPYWKLNPSYVPLQLLRALYQHTQDQRWLKLVDSSQRLIIDSAPQGFSPDWIKFHHNSGFEQQSQDGSYNAIRVYLWAGMLHPDDPYRNEQLRQLNPMAIHIGETGTVPEHTDNQTGKTRDTGPIGFSAALMPFLQAVDAHKALNSQLIRLLKQPMRQIPKHYYNNVLALFALGFLQDRYQFDANGQLTLPWYKAPKLSTGAER